MKNLASLKVKIFADGADKEGMLQLNANPLIKGMTTNPSLMRKAGVHDYEAFARDILKSITEKPISFEVFSDEFPEMRRQALKIKDWGKNVYVKIPITNTRGESSLPLVRELAQRRREAQHHRHFHRGTGRRRRPGAQSQSARRGFRVCRSHRRHWRGPDSAHARRE